MCSLLFFWHVRILTLGPHICAWLPYDALRSVLPDRCYDNVGAGSSSIWQSNGERARAHAQRFLLRLVMVACEAETICVFTNKVSFSLLKSTAHGNTDAHVSISVEYSRS